MDANTIGKTLFMIGIGLAAIGLLIWIVGKMGMPLGQLPGDVSYQGKKIDFSFPIVSMLVISIFLTLILNLIVWLMRK